LNRFLRTLYPTVVFLLMFCVLAWSAVGLGQKPLDAYLPKLNEPSCGDVHLRTPQENSCRINPIKGAR
jgi:hypothetical protein